MNLMRVVFQFIQHCFVGAAKRIAKIRAQRGHATADGAGWVSRYLEHPISAVVE